MKNLLLTAAILCIGFAGAAWANNYVSATLSDSEQRAINSETVTAANTIAQTECGKTFFLSTTGAASTLPPPTAGCKFKFFVVTEAQSFTVVTSSSANVLVGSVNELEVDTSDDGPYIANGDTITFVSGTADKGDYMDCESDGTSWYCIGQADKDGGITVTQAS